MSSVKGKLDEVLWEMGVGIAGVETGMDINRAIISRSIKGSDTLENFSSTPDSMDTVRKVSRGKITLKI